MNRIVGSISTITSIKCNKFNCYNNAKAMCTYILQQSIQHADFINIILRVCESFEFRIVVLTFRRCYGSQALYFVSNPKGLYKGLKPV